MGRSAFGRGRRHQSGHALDDARFTKQRETDVGFAFDDQQVFAQQDLGGLDDLRAAQAPLVRLDAGAEAGEGVHQRVTERFVVLIAEDQLLLHAASASLAAAAPLGGRSVQVAGRRPYLTTSQRPFAQTAAGGTPQSGLGYGKQVSLQLTVA